MGYRSDIRISTTKKGFEELKKYVTENTKDINLFDDLSVKEEGNTNVYFGWDFLKWYPGFNSVDNVMDGLEHLKNNDLSYHYKRLGENYDDIEVQYYDSPNDVLDEHDIVDLVDTDDGIYDDYYEDEIEGDDDIGL